MKPIRLSKAGKSYGGRPFGRGELYALLANPIYIGRIQHKGVLHQGLHPAIIDLPVWEAVQEQLKQHRNGERHIRSAFHPSLLAGKLVDENGQPLVAYPCQQGCAALSLLCQPRSPARRQGCQGQWPAHSGGGDREAGLRSAGRAARRSGRADRADQSGSFAARQHQISNIIAICRDTVAVLRGSDHLAIAGLIAPRSSNKITVRRDGLTVALNAQGITSLLKIGHPARRCLEDRDGHSSETQARGLCASSGSAERQRRSPQPDDRLLKTIATAREWWKQLVADPKLRIADLAAANARRPRSWVTRVLRLAFLDPAIIQQIIAGTAPVALTFDSLRAPDAVPALWSAQRALHQISIARLSCRGKFRTGKFGRERKGGLRAPRAPNSVRQREMHRPETRRHAGFAGSR